LIVFLLVLAAAELAWRLAGHRFDVANVVGWQLTNWLHPYESARAEPVELAQDYAHAAWLLVAVPLAAAAAHFESVRAVARATTTSHRMGWLLLALGVAGVAVLITPEMIATPVLRAWQAREPDRHVAKESPPLALVRTCHDAIRKHFAGKPVVTIDSGIDPAQAYIYTYELDRAPSMHFVRLARSSSDVSPASVAPSLRGLAPPIQGGYIVSGLVLYSGDNPAVNWSDHREYHCGMLVTGDRFEVRDLRFNVVR